MQPYTLFTVKMGAPSRGSMVRCQQVFSTGSRALYTEFEAPIQSANQLIVQLGDHSPAFNSLISWRVSRFFKMTSRDGYSGYWRWNSRPYEFQGKSLSAQSNKYIDHFFNRWVRDFSRNEDAVKELREISHQTDPLRKIQVGIKMGDVPWAGVTLFDGSTKLYTFRSEGKLEIETSKSDSRSDIEVRFPELMIPERILELQGKSVQVFFLSMLTSLKEIHAAVPDIYHRVATLLLLKTNPQLLEAKVPENNKKEDPEIQRILSMDAFRPVGQSAPRGLEQPAHRALGIKIEDFEQALKTAEGLRMYGVTHTNLLDYYLKQGWKVLEVQEGVIPNPNIKVIYFDIYEFILKYFRPEEVQSKAEATEAGKNSDEYKEEARKQAEMMERILERFRKLRAATH